MNKIGAIKCFPCDINYYNENEGAANCLVNIRICIIYIKMGNKK